SYTIPANQLPIGKHQLKVYAMDDTGRQSTISKLVIHVIGDLSFTQVAKVVSFQDVIMTNKSTVARRNNDWNIQVKDTRGTGSRWYLTATLTEEFTNQNGNKLPHSLIYIDDMGNKSTMDVGVPIEVYRHTDVKQQEVTVQWNDDQGVLFQVPPSAYEGEYTGT